ncbi:MULTISPECIES: phytanoyl-CoA dioxygenase family protein [Serratia]|uniref:Phytanoyl-CoA dioxygenase (PhyH) n=1 Tax=Serratia quinivorans TaxID=137545 RepID=A0A379ZY37_9GAMM|nr:MULTISPECIES: phytanoyl-CoA dioxygenase family protein [Serratia]RYM64294.1 hypothetical protein BSR03_04345 [Serratia proteamaculans]CAI1879203.1 Phytanoyl-CoA dioxygenase (PhyH) [Serratia quinivorans]SUI70673.1 Phytanoyl-CoA dioxygenase (PhyH) [Serratia quinivorans]
METNYIINNAQAGYPTRKVVSKLAQYHHQNLVEDGYTIIHNLFTEQQLTDFSSALGTLEENERHLDDPMYKNNTDSIYLRWLLTKDRRFWPFNSHPELIALARMALGPQIQLDDADARITFADVIDGTGWHIHLRTVPDPLPPFFCYPHALHHLLYLDNITEREGGLCVLPSSHKDNSIKIEANSHHSIDGERILYPGRGDVVLMHANLWHRAVKSQRGGKKRRLMLGAFSPSWLNTHYEVGKRGEHDWRKAYAMQSDTDEHQEFAGYFSWA